MGHFGVEFAPHVGRESHNSAMPMALQFPALCGRRWLGLDRFLLARKLLEPSISFSVRSFTAPLYLSGPQDRFLQYRAKDDSPRG